LSVLALTLTGCGGTGTVRRRPPASPKAEAATANRVEPLTDTPDPQLPVTVSSADGKKVTVSNARRIVPLSGSLSEIVFTLGLGDRVVARDITATFQQAAKLPLVTRNHDVSAESVLSLKPDLVLAETTTGTVRGHGTRSAPPASRSSSSTRRRVSPTSARASRRWPTRSAYRPRARS
jgi:iron complex transport system substrate-binding protein